MKTVIRALIRFLSWIAGDKYESTNAEMQLFNATIKSIKSNIDKADPEFFGPFFAMFWTQDRVNLLVDREGNIVLANVFFYKTLGYTREEVETKSYLNFLYEGDVEKTNQYFMDFMEGNPHYHNLHNRYVAKGGSLVELSWQPSMQASEIMWGSAYLVGAKEPSYE